jgi:hypothetical protein
LEIGFGGGFEIFEGLLSGVAVAVEVLKRGECIGGKLAEDDDKSW